MKAVILKKPKQGLAIEEIEIPLTKENEVLIKLNYAALNHRDIWARKGQYIGDRENIILGSDGMGIVSQSGSFVESSLIGKKVIINPGHNWGENQAVFSKDFKILGNPDPGTLAEYICVDAQYVHLKPEHLSDEEAASLPLAGLTIYRALFTKGNLKAGEKVLITGIGGGTALFALQFAKAAGADVYVTSSNNQKIDKAIELGAKGGANYKNVNWTEDLKLKAEGFDLIIDSASGEGFKDLIELANPGGRIVFFGSTDGMISEILPLKIFWKSLSILGTSMGSPDEFLKMLAFVKEHQIKPIISKVFDSFVKADEAFDYMEQGHQFGKIVIRTTV